MNYEEKLDCGDYIIHTRVYPKPIHTCVGVNSDTYDNKHVVLLDYDDCKVEVVLKDMAYIAVKFGLGAFFLYQTGPTSWHLRSPVKLTFQEMTRVVSETHTDPYIFDELTGYKRRNTHRISKRGERMAPTLRKVFMIPTQREISKSHWEFFKKDYWGNLGDFERQLIFDDTKIDDVPMVIYQTAKRGDGSYGKN